MPGTSTLAAENAHGSQHGLWVLRDAEELFLPIEPFPWVRHAGIHLTVHVIRDLATFFAGPPPDQATA